MIFGDEQIGIYSQSDYKIAMTSFYGNFSIYGIFLPFLAIVSARE